MKKIDTIIIHCSATHAGQDIKAKDIESVTMIIASGSAISVALMLTVNLPTPGPRHRKRQWTI